MENPESVRTDIVSDVHSVLADSDRRMVVRHVAANGGTATVSELIESLPDRADSPDEDRIARLRLLHRHLPKMTETGILRHDRDHDRVALTQLGWSVETSMRRVKASLQYDSGVR